MSRLPRRSVVNADRRKTVAGYDPRDDDRGGTLPVACTSCQIGTGGICKVLAPAQLRELGKAVKHRRLDAGSRLVGQGEPVASYVNVLRGVVKLSKLLSDGRQQIVGLQFSSDFVGRPFSAESPVTAEAAVDLEVCVIPKTTMDRLLAEQQELQHRLHEQTLADLDLARDWMLTLGRKKALEKVATFIYFIADKNNVLNATNVEFELPLTREEMADFLGLTIETVSRQMTNLRKTAIISIQNKRIVNCPDLARLKRAGGIE